MAIKITKTTYCMSECYIASYNGISVYGWTEEEAIRVLKEKLAEVK